MIAAAQSGFNQLIIGIAVGFILLATPLLFKFLISLSRDVRDIKGVLITPEPTPLVPNPERGLVDKVADLMTKATLTASGTAALLRDSRPNDGSTSRDVLDRIEEATKENP
jgi:hypothetical protein